LDPAVAFGRVLRQLRLEAGLTQEKLGFEANLRRTYISMLELGQQQPTLTTIFKLAKGLGRSANDLIAMVEAETARKRQKR
jgi:transcriptional regulator with XRE-family HTH domain